MGLSSLKQIYYDVPMHVKNVICVFKIYLVGLDHDFSPIYLNHYTSCTCNDVCKQARKLT